MIRFSHAALTIAALTVAVAPAAHAQNLYVTSGSYNAGNNTYQNGIIYLGRDASGGQFSSGGAPYVATLNVIAGGVVKSGQSFNASTVNVSGGRLDILFTYQNGTVNISGGSVGNADALNDNTVAITGGSVGIIRSKGNSAVSISGGSVDNAYGFNSGRVNISGGTVNNTTAFDSSAFRISGGTLTSGVHLYGTSATANFVGTGLGFAYQSSGTNNQYGEFADFFNVTGTIGGVAKTIGVTIYNQGSANSAARQFTFNGAAPTPVVVPEAGTFALFGAGLAVFGAVVVRRRK